MILVSSGRVDALEPKHSERILYLALHDEVYQSVFVTGIGKLFLESHDLRLVVFDPDLEEIRQWIK
jgi:hypothetical protein